MATTAEGNIYTFSFWTKQGAGGGGYIYTSSSTNLGVEILFF